MSEGALTHRLGIIKADVRYFAKHHRWWAIVRIVPRTLFGDYGERCQLCGRGWSFVWHAPDPLWRALVNSDLSGCVCPACFDTAATAEGFDLRWTPIVAQRNGVPTSNWWHDPTFDALAMSEPDPDYYSGGLVRVPQPVWREVREGLALVGSEIMAGVAYSVYPLENCVPIASASKPEGAQTASADFEIGE
jgi:hypothetical protein